MKNNLEEIREVLFSKKDDAKAKGQKRFFKTGPGQYAEGDRFLGVVVPELHQLSREFIDTQEDTLQDMLGSPWHEERLLALLVLRRQYCRDKAEQKKKCHFYLLQKEGINNWDLVDLSAPYILGQETSRKRYRKERDELLLSNRMWDRRIAIVSTLALIRKDEVNDTFLMAKDLLGDKEDLMHKATGWMLREAGKRDKKSLYRFLDSYAAEMPRTMLRYSLERVPPAKRDHYMKKKSN